jgi:hypothetical protein
MELSDLLLMRNGGSLAVAWSGANRLATLLVTIEV